MNHMLDQYYRSVFQRMEENKFTNYCGDNEIEDLDEEFYEEIGVKMDPFDCLLVDFDKDDHTEENHFPLPFQTDVVPEQAIFNILLYMYERQQLPNYEQLENIIKGENDEEKVIQDVYKTQKISEDEKGTDDTNKKREIAKRKQFGKLKINLDVSEEVVNNIISNVYEKQVSCLASAIGDEHGMFQPIFIQ